MTPIILSVIYVITILIARVGMRKVTRYTRHDPTLVDVAITLLPIINVFISWILVLNYGDRTGLCKRYFGIKDVDE